MAREPRNIGASVRARLLDRARTAKTDFRFSSRATRWRDCSTASATLTCASDSCSRARCSSPADAKGRLIAILLTRGEAHDCPVAERLFRRVERPKHMLGDTAYDSTELREELNEHATGSVIPNRSNRKEPYSFSRRLYKLRWRIEAAFNRLKDFRRIATRYDRLARNYLSSVCLASALVWWT
jgi:transposase